jgi:hypothetical protein
MGRPANVIPRIVVEDCEIVKASDALACLKLGLHFIGRRTCKRLGAEPATILVIRAFCAFFCGLRQRPGRADLPLPNKMTAASLLNSATANPK